MMETLEQQQTKITTDLEPHDVSDTSPTAIGAASEEDDFDEEYHSAAEVEEGSSEQSQCSNMVAGEQPQQQPSNKSTSDDANCDLAIDAARGDELLESKGIVHKDDIDEHAPIVSEASPRSVIKEVEEENLEQSFGNALEKTITLNGKEATTIDDNETEDEDEKPLVVDDSIVKTVEDTSEIDETKIDENSSRKEGFKNEVTSVEKLGEAVVLSDDSEEQETNTTQTENDDCMPVAIKLENEELPDDTILQKNETINNANSRRSSCGSQEEITLMCDDIKTNLQSVDVSKIKINGAHDTHEVADEKQEATSEKSNEDLAVILTNNIGNDNNQQNEIPESTVSNVQQKVDNRSTHLNDEADGVDSDSSSSQQLVIDHSENEQNAKVMPLKLSMKRRRSTSSSALNEEKKPKTASVEEESHEHKSDKSLLLERLQQPLQTTVVPETCETNAMLTCFKCKLQNFENFQQLNEHFSTCNAMPATADVVATTLPLETTPSVASSSPPASAPAEGAGSITIRKERFFRCARCQTVHQCWNFFLHMRDVHERYICLYCSHVYATVEKLAMHLENKHDIDQKHLTLEAWQVLHQKENRVSHVICCTCQATFLSGVPFDDHDCSEFMQPCTLCGLKGSHTDECRNNSINKPGKRKRYVRRKKNANLPATNATNNEHNIPMSTSEFGGGVAANESEHESTPASALKVKIMLRVPKEFQKSVDAALSSTDSEDEPDGEIEEESPTEMAEATDSPMQMLEGTEQPTMLPAIEAGTSHAEVNTSLFQNVTTDLLPVAETDDSPMAKLTRVLAEFERTKLDIQRTKEDIMNAKKQSKMNAAIAASVPAPQIPAEAAVLPAMPPEERRWSPTPPASPHNNNHIETVPQTATHVLNDVADMVRRQSQGSECMELDDSLNDTAIPVNESHPEQQHDKPAQDQEQKSEVETNNQTVLDFGFDMAYDVDNNKGEQPNAISPAKDTAEGNIEPDAVELQLDRALDKHEMVDFVRICLKAVYSSCLYCNHARRIAVNGKELVLHLINEHRFTATVDSITAEELHVETIMAKLKSFVPLLEQEYLNSASYCTVDKGKFVLPFNERIYECFQCRYVASTHKDLYTHNRRLHIKTNIMCVMCHSSFYSFSEILCHICPGKETTSSDAAFEMKFRCCLCDAQELPSAFRLMVHLRKQHFACDICLEDCYTQSKLSSHVWKHKLMHLCYRCNIAYRNKLDISKHLFWKHGTESISCKRCLQKRWSHVYHFCVPPTEFSCEICLLTFSKAIYLEVHKRMHTGDFRYACTEDQCDEKFVSRRLLLKHAATHETTIQASIDETNNEMESQKHANGKGNQNDMLTTKEIKLENLDQSLSVEAGVAQGEKTAQETPNRAKSEEKSAIDKEAIKTKRKEAEHLSQTERETGNVASTAVSETPIRKRRKKNKRTKESLEDLNLMVPNLSETDSSDDTDSGSVRTELRLPIRPPVDDDLNMPRVMLSPTSDSDNEDKDKKEDSEKKEAQLLENSSYSAIANENSTKSEKVDIPKEEKLEPKEMDLDMEEGCGGEDAVPDIWKNLLKNQGVPANMIISNECGQLKPANVSKPQQEMKPQVSEEQPKVEDDWTKPGPLHVVCSDHDYCSMKAPPKMSAEKKMRIRTTTSKSNARQRPANDSDSDSSSSSSSSSDSSSCSCGSNCSCSSSSSDNSSSDSSSDDSDTSNNTHSSPTKRQRKKSMRSKKHNELAMKANKKDGQSPQSEKDIQGQQQQEEDIDVNVERASTPLKQPLYNESDFDTAVSDTDEDFYDPHPQRVANEMLARKRAELLGELAGRNNYDIVENSRPSTPSLPEEMTAFADKPERNKNKKKKRERKSTNKFLTTENIQTHTHTHPHHHTHNHQAHQTEHLGNVLLQVPSTPLFLHDPQHVNVVPTIAPVPQSLNLPSTPLLQPTLQQSSRFSEGSNSSEVDVTLKRSKRTRRPNKFYGYTSDDENMSSVLAPSLQVGMQLIKPQPPPQLTWAKEDLPSPTKSILNPLRNKPPSRTPKPPLNSSPLTSSILHSNGMPSEIAGGSFGTTPTTSSSATRKRSKRTLLSGVPDKSSSRKRSAKRSRPSEQLPPIPTLKIRPGLLAAAGSCGGGSDSSDTSSMDEDTEINVTSLGSSTPIVTPPVGNVPSGIPTPQQQQLNSLLPPPMAMPPAPAATAFNQPIPPALLPNPDFATLQYFKANNIRYPIRPPAGARLAREGESVYCYCRCPYDEVSEMIACDGSNCLIEWFHFECVGIMVAPQGKWFCAECRPKYSEGLYVNNSSTNNN